MATVINNNSSSNSSPPTATMVTQSGHAAQCAPTILDKFENFQIRGIPFWWLLPLLMPLLRSIKTHIVVAASSETMYCAAAVHTVCLTARSRRWGNQKRQQKKWKRQLQPTPSSSSGSFARWLVMGVEIGMITFHGPRCWMREDASHRALR